MDVISALRVLLRHPIVVAVTLLLSGFLAVLLITRATPEYEARASVLLLPPATTLDQNGQPIEINPYRDPASVQVIAPSLLAVINTPQFVEDLNAKGLAGDFVIETNPGGSGGLLSIRTVNALPEAALSDLQLVMDQMRIELTRIQQEDVPDPNKQIGVQTLTASTAATKLTGSKARVLLIVVALGAVASYALSRLADVSYGEFHPILDRLRRRRVGGEAHHAASAADHDGEPDWLPAFAQSIVEVRPSEPEAELDLPPANTA